MITKYTISTNPANQKRADAVEDWDKNHYFIQSKAVVNGLVSVHKDTNEPCAKNPCRQALRLQDLGINMEAL
jgi:hypothetical protein